MTSAPNVGGDRGLVVRQQGALGHELIAAGLLMLAGPTDLDAGASPPLRLSVS